MATFPQAPLDVQAGLLLRPAGATRWSLTNNFGTAPVNTFTVPTTSVPLLLPGDQFQIHTSAGPLKETTIFTIASIGGDFFGNTAVTFTPAAAAVLAVGDVVTQTTLWTSITSYVYQREGTSPPLSVTRGRPDESAQVNASALTCEINNRDGRFSVKNPVGPYYGKLSRNTPIRVSLPASSAYLRIEDDNTSYVSTPDKAALDITGDLDVRIDVDPTSYVRSVLAAKWEPAGNQRSWLLEFRGDGTLNLWWSPDGTNALTAQSTMPVPAGRTGLRATLDVNNGAGGWTVTFYTAPSIAGPWTQLGDPVTGTGTTSVFASTAPLAVGWNDDWAANHAAFAITGRTYGMQLLNGIGGTVAASPDFTAATPGAPSLTDGQGNVWTLNGTAEFTDRDYRFHGETSSLPVAWDTTGKDVWVPLTAGGLLRRLGQGNAPLDSSLKRAIVSLTGTRAAVAYWPCEDLQGSVSIGSATGGPLMQVSGGTGDGQVTTTGPAFASDSSFLCSLPLPTVNGSTWRGQVPSYHSNGGVFVRFLMKIGTVPPSGSRIVRVTTTGTISQLALYFQVSGGNLLGIAGFNSSGGTVFDSGGFNFSSQIPGVGMWMSMELKPGTGGTSNYALFVLIPGVTNGLLINGTYTGTVGNATSVTVNPFGDETDVTIGHVSVQSDAESLFDLAQPLDAWQGETAGARFVRLCGENGIQPRTYGPPAATAPMGAQAAQTLTTLLQECEDADRGQLYEPRSALALGYRTQAFLLNQPPAATIDYSQAQLGAEGGGNPVQPTMDDQYTRNDITVQRSSGNISGASYRFILADGSPMSVSAPPDGVGDYSDSKSVNVQSDSQLPDLASWMVHVGTVDEARWPVIPVNLARPAAAGIAAAVQAADVGDFIAVTNPPAQLPPDEIKQLITGTNEGLGGFHYQAEFSCVPESPYETAISDDPVYGRADTDGSALAAAVTTTATSLSVATTDLTTPLWTTSGGDFPFDINIGGERITVTNITGTSSPQSFTVTRAVNGVVKAHSSGGDVRLWFPPILAML